MMKLFMQKSREVKRIYENHEAFSWRKTDETTGKIFNVVADILTQIQQQLGEVDDQDNDEALKARCVNIQNTFSSLSVLIDQIDKRFRNNGATLPQNLHHAFTFFCSLKDDIATLKNMPNEVEVEINDCIIERRLQATTTTSSTYTSSEAVVEYSPEINCTREAYEQMMRQRQSLPLIGKPLEELGELFAPLYRAIQEAIARPNQLTLAESQRIQEHIIRIIEFLVKQEDLFTEGPEKNAISSFINHLVVLNKQIAEEATNVIDKEVEAFLDYAEDDDFVIIPSSTATSSTEETSEVVKDFSIAEYHELFIFGQKKTAAKPMQKTDTEISPDTEDVRPTKKP